MNPQLACARAVAILTAASHSSESTPAEQARNPDQIKLYLEDVVELLRDLPADDQLLAVGYLGDLAHAFASALSQERDTPVERLIQDVAIIVAASSTDPT